MKLGGILGGNGKPPVKFRAPPAFVHSETGYAVGMTFGAASYSITRPPAGAPATPLVFASPHSGDIYPDDLGAARFDGLDRRWQLFGLDGGKCEQADAGQQAGYWLGSNHCVDASFRVSSARARLACESSPRWLPTWRPSAL